MTPTQIADQIARQCLRDAPDEDVMVTFDVADVPRIIEALRQAVLEARADFAKQYGGDDA